MLSVVVILLGAFVLVGIAFAYTRRPSALIDATSHLVKSNPTKRSPCSAAQRRLQNEATSPRERPRRAALIGSTAPGATSQLRNSCLRNSYNADRVSAVR